MSQWSEKISEAIHHTPYLPLSRCVSTQHKEGAKGLLLAVRSSEAMPLQRYASKKRRNRRGKELNSDALLRRGQKLRGKEENLSETVSSTRYFFGSPILAKLNFFYPFNAALVRGKLRRGRGYLNIQINNFQKSSKKFVVDLLTRNVALNLSGALFFVGLGYSLKWWYKDQLFIILLKQNLPALQVLESESQPNGSNVSWETSESILNGEYQTGTPLIDRIDLYANHICVNFKQPWQKHVYERFIGVFGEPAQINVCKHVKFLTSAASEGSTPLTSVALEGYHFAKEPLPAGRNYSEAAKRRNVLAPTLRYGKERSFARTPLPHCASTVSRVTKSNDSEASASPKIGNSFANIIPFYLLPLNMENPKNLFKKTVPAGIESKKIEERNNFSGRFYRSKEVIVQNKVLQVVNKFSTYTPDQSVFPKRWFKLSPRNLSFLNQGFLRNPLFFSVAERHSFHPSDADCEAQLVRGFLAQRGGDKMNAQSNSLLAQRQTFLRSAMNVASLPFLFTSSASVASEGSTSTQKELCYSESKEKQRSETVIKLSYPLQLTKKLAGWQPSPNLLVLNSYRDEIPYKLENALQSYFPKKDSQLLFLYTSFKKAIILPTTNFLLPKSIKPLLCSSVFDSRAAIDSLLTVMLRKERLSQELNFLDPSSDALLPEGVAKRRRCKSCARPL
jgi:hypothetical protein